MEDVFNNLESNDLLTVEEAKNELTKTFSQTKDPFLVGGMMDYFSHTNSVRIVDVLVKVQTPHDNHIFDKLLEWVNTSKRNQAFTLFWHIVKKHPSWLYKVASHQFFREILKVLRTEHNIITTMMALYCIIILLPIIPTAMPLCLQELFEIIMYLATWKTKNVPELTGNQKIHLQIGISILFQRLYGMYPCNFTTYLRNNAKENQSVFETTINPILETVKMHPKLLTSNMETEKQNSRWKEMEPHDVVVECSKFSLDEGPKAQESESNYAENTWYNNYSSDTSVTKQLQDCMKNMMSPIDPNSPLHSKFASDYRPRAKSQQRADSIWSPSIAVLATPPPTNTVPHTPTPIMPGYGIQAISSMAQYQPSGASPPEAAVEATPETTPMKDYMKPHRPFPVNSTAARTIWPNSSQPSSPLKKDEPPFRFPDNASVTHLKNFEHEFGLPSSKLMKVMNDRNMSQQIFNDRQLAMNEANSNRLFEIEIQQANSADMEKEDASSKTVSGSNSEESQEDQEVTEINKRQMNRQLGPKPTENENESTENVKDKKQQRKSLAQCYQKTNMESFDLNRRRTEDNHSESDDDVSNRNVSKSWPGLKLKIPRSEYKNHTTHTDNGNANADKNLGAIEETVVCSVAIQTTEQFPQTYEHMYVELLADELNRKKNAPNNVVNSTPMSPRTLLDQYIEIPTIKLSATDANSRTEAEIQLLMLLLQYETYRREVYAERNRRLLGKSRDSAALKMDNDKLKYQTESLAKELQTMSENLNKAKLEQIAREQENFAECSRLRSEIQVEREKNKQFAQSNESLERSFRDEMDAKRQLTTKLEIAQAEIFDVKNLLHQCQLQADVGNQYKEELHRLQAEVALMGEIQMKCRDKFNEMNSLQARDADLETTKRAYSEEVNELRTSLELKSSQLDTARDRIATLESQLTRKEHMFTEQKRLLKTVKEEYQEKIKAVEEKYSAQKAIILHLEENMFDLYKNKSAVNTSTQDADKTEIVGSLDHTSPLSISLASSDGLSLSLRSVTEIKNLQALVVSSENSNQPIQNIASTIFSGGNTNGLSTAPIVPGNRVSDDIPVPIPGQSQSIHSHQHHHHQ